MWMVHHDHNYYQKRYHQLTGLCNEYYITFEETDGIDQYLFQLSYTVYRLAVLCEHREDAHFQKEIFHPLLVWMKNGRVRVLEESIEATKTLCFELEFCVSVAF